MSRTKFQLESVCASTLSDVRKAEADQELAKRAFALTQRRIGAELRSVRKEADVSLRTAARRMKVSAMFVSDLERGQRNWTQVIVNRFFVALEVGK